MALVEQIARDLREAMKSKSESTLSALRLVAAALKNTQINLGHALSDAEAQQVIRTMVKQYTDALQDFTSAGRSDLAEKQRAEIGLLQKYLPAQMSEPEIEKISQNVISTMNATQKDAGRVIGAVMKEVAGRADGNAVKGVVERLLREVA